MVKETKFFRKQADKAERMARSAPDVEISQRYLNMAQAYRSQAEILKAKNKKKAERKLRKRPYVGFLGTLTFRLGWSCT